MAGDTHTGAAGHTLILVPARGGSKGIPRKNIKPLAGRPLIHYTLEVGRELEEEGVGTLCVSTDDGEIRRTAEDFGVEVPFLRPARLATDEAGSHEVILHALDWYAGERGREFGRVILLQPTSPFRTAEHVRRALELWDEEVEMVASVTETDANPYYVLFEENERGWLEPSKEGDFRRRQDAPEVWELNGAVYVMRTDALRRAAPSQFTRVRKMVMDRRSSLDLDTPLDWTIAECLAGDE